MGRKKAFINKKEATTYSLVYRNAEDDATAPEAREGTLVPSDQLAGRLDREGNEALAAPEDHLAFARSLFHDEIDEVSEERRREILEYGFADDGYDYLKHLRVLGKGTASLEGVVEPIVQEQEAAGPSVFLAAPELVAPAEDVKLIDAAHLHVRSLATDETVVEDYAHEVSAYARPRPADTLHRQARTEVQELQAAIEETDKAADGTQPDYADWLDEFVVAASKPKAAGSSAVDAAAEAASTQPGDSGDDSYTDIESGDEDENEDEDEGPSTASRNPLTTAPNKAQPGRRIAGGSIASTYWRPERHDRNNHLDVVDQRFERLALQYEDDELGELEDDDPGLRGTAGGDDLQLQRAVDEFIAEHPRPCASGSDSDGSELESITDEDEGEHGQDATLLAGSSARRAEGLQAPKHAHKGMQGRTGPAVEAGEGEILVPKDKEIIKITRARLEKMLEKGDAGTEREAYVEVVEHEQWDCESVLSLLSNRENHPGRIGEPLKPRRPVPAAAAAGLITLSSKTGLPLMASQPKAADAAGPAPASTAAAAAPPQGTRRPKDETPEERRARKAAVKEDRRETRAAKKELKTMFKDEAKRQKKQLAAAPAVNSIISIA